MKPRQTEPDRIDIIFLDKISDIVESSRKSKLEFYQFLS